MYIQIVGFHELAYRENLTSSALIPQAASSG